MTSISTFESFVRAEIQQAIRLGKLTERSIQRDLDHPGQRRALLVTLNLPSNTAHALFIRRVFNRHDDAVVASLLELFVICIQCLRLTAKQNAASGLLEEHKDDHDKDCRDDRVGVVDPSPCSVRDDHTREQRCQAGSKECGA